MTSLYDSRQRVARRREKRVLFRVDDKKVGRLRAVAGVADPAGEEGRFIETAYSRITNKLVAHPLTHKTMIFCCKFTKNVYYTNMEVVNGVSAASSGVIPLRRPDFPSAGVRRGVDVPSVPVTTNNTQANTAVSTAATRTPATQLEQLVRPASGNDPQAEIRQSESEGKTRLKTDQQEEAFREEAVKKTGREEASKSDARKEAEKEQEQTDEARRQAFAENIQRKFGDILQAQSRLEFIGKHANVTA